MKKLPTGLVLLILVIAAFVNYQMAQSDIAKAKNVLPLLSTELNNLKQMQDSVFVREQSSFKRGMASVGKSFDTKKSSDDIFLYYDNELKTNGWSYYKEKAVHFGKVTIYQKGEYIAKVEIDPDTENSYTIYVSWGFKE